LHKLHYLSFFPLNTQMFHYHEKVSLGISSPLMPFREDSMALCPLSSIFVGTVVKKWRQASFVSYRFCRLFSIIINVVCFIPAIGILDGPHCSKNCTTSRVSGKEFLSLQTKFVSLLLGHSLVFLLLLLLN